MTMSATPHATVPQRHLQAQPKENLAADSSRPAGSFLGHLGAALLRANPVDGLPARDANPATARARFYRNLNSQ